MLCLQATSDITFSSEPILIFTYFTCYKHNKQLLTTQ